MTLRILDLFAGIGGMSYGLTLASPLFQPAGFVEVDSFCRAVLQKNFPGVPVFGDVRDYRGGEVGSVDVICGGPPCQPFSTAGDRDGMADDRWLWPEMYRIVVAERPRWVVVENVFDFLEMALEEVYADLASAGYVAWPVVLGAVSVDAPHWRRRVFVVANADFDEQAGGRPGEVSGPSVEERLSEFDAVQRAGGADCLWPGGGWRWASEPGVARMADGVPGRVDRNRALGNAVVPQILEMFGLAILEVECEQA